MTEQQIAALGPAFATYLRRYRPCFVQDQTAKHFGTYCLGLLSDLPRKSVEPIALAAGTAVRTLQEFLAAGRWDHAAARDTLQRHLAGVIAGVPADGVGTAGVIDETTCRKWGGYTPGVQRQYLGCVGKVENGIVTVHVGVARGTFQALLDADLYLPKGWADDRPRSRSAGVPDAARHRARWRVAVDRLLRVDGTGVRFDWLTFDAWYGAAVPFLTFLNPIRQRFVAEVPVSFSVRDAAGGPSQRADSRLSAADARVGRRHRVAHRTVRTSVWRAATAGVRVADREHTLVVAVNEATAEVKYFLTNATAEPLARVLAVALRRWTVEHAFRLGKQEAGLMDYAGRDHTGLDRHLTLALVVLGFVATHTERLRGKNPLVTAEQVCRALNQRCGAAFRRRRGVPEARHASDVIRYQQRRNARAARSHQRERHRPVARSTGVTDREARRP